MICLIIILIIIIVIKLFSTNIEYYEIHHFLLIFHFIQNLIHDLFQYNYDKCSIYLILLI